MPKPKFPILSLVIVSSIVLLAPSIVIAQEINEGWLYPKLNRLAGKAAIEAAWLDACTQSGGADVRSDFMARADGLSENNRSKVVKQYEQTYERYLRSTKLKIEKRAKRNQDICDASHRGRKIAKQNYERAIASADQPPPQRPQNRAAAAAEKPTAADIPVLEESPIERIDAADLDGLTKAIGTPLMMAKHDATIAACGEGRDPMIRANVVTIIENTHTSGGVEKTIKKYDKHYSTYVAAYQKSGCRPQSPQQAYENYQSYHDRNLKRAAAVRAARDNPQQEPADPHYEKCRGLPITEHVKCVAALESEQKR